MTSKPAGTYYLAGPTAVGKSEVAVRVAERLGAEIVGCDAYQIYQGLPVLTAQPEANLLQRVRHHMIGEIPLTETMDVAKYCTLAKERIAEVHNRGKAVLAVGGTGMYLRALTHGLAELPAADPGLREELENLPASERDRRLKELDPAAYQTIDRQNPRRVIRALEVCLLTGKRFSDFRDQWASVPHGLQGVLLERSREGLNERINRRTIQMFEQGVLEELARIPALSATASQTLGLRQLQLLLEGKINRSLAIEQIQQATRQYAKRQMTWFKREQWMARVHVLHSDQPEDTATQVLQAFNQS